MERLADIFISYSHKDRSWVKQLVDALTAEGYMVWWDLEIRAGSPFDKVIESTLKKVPCVVVVWSRYSVESGWVRDESAWAKDRNKLVSIRIDEDLELPLQFYHVHTDSLVSWQGSRAAPSFRKLVLDIQKIAGLPLLPAANFQPETLLVQQTDPQTLPKKQPKSKLFPPIQSGVISHSNSENAFEAASISVRRRRRNVVVMIMSLVVAALIGSAIYEHYRTIRESDDDKTNPCNLPWQQQPTYCP